MIGALKGVALAVGEDALIVDVGGVGYVVQAGARTLARIEPGAPLQLSIETQVREDSIRLFGFLGEEERLWFTFLQSIPGVGAKVALAIVDTLGAQGVADAVALQDKASMARANGVGPKLAGRIVQELAGKAPPRGFFGAAIAAAPAMAGAPAAQRQEAVSALVNLGIDQASAARAVAEAMKAMGADAPTGDLIRAALKEVAR